MAKQTLIGKVVSSKMQNTVVVEVERLIRHPVYKKIIKRSKRIKADTDGNEVVLGQNVEIEQTRPVSRGKKFKIVKILGKK